MENDIITYNVTITGYNSDGDGVARLDDGKVVFVRGSARDDFLEVRLTEEKPRSVRAEIVCIITPSPYRTHPEFVATIVNDKVKGIGLFKNMMWGLVLSVINCIIAMAMMMTVLPFGIMDGILAGTALILILTKNFNRQKIVEVEYAASGKLHDAKDALKTLRRKHFG